MPTTVGILEYPLVNGYIHNWIVAGPHAAEVKELERFTGPDWKLQVARYYYQSESGLESVPAEFAPCKAGGYEGAWNYVSTRDDHFVDLTAFYHITHYLRAWAYAKVLVEKGGEVQMALTTNGPADVWVNGAHCHRQEHFHHQTPHSVRFQAALKDGENEILVRMEEVAARECPFAMALHLEGVEGIVRLPTTVSRLDRRIALEKAFQAAIVRQDIFAFDEVIGVQWPEEAFENVGLTTRLQSPAGRIYAQTNKSAAPGRELLLGEAFQFLDGEYRVALMPSEKEYYEGNMRIKREITLRIGHGKYSAQPYGTYAERRIEALKDAAVRSGLHVFAEIALMALGMWQRVDTALILKTTGSINQRADCSDFYLAGLIGMLYRYGEDPNFPEALRQPLEDCILNFKYWNDEPGSDAMCYTTENHSILFHTCEVLAGQLYPERVFSNNGQTGQWHRETGERRALEWLQKRAASGFHEWDSNCYFEEDVLALSTLADLGETQEVWEMAAVVLDKLFFTMAVNSYKGVFGSTHGRTYTPFIKGGLLEATSGMSRLAWGMGQFNDHIMGTVSMACAEYEVPPQIAAIAADLPEEMWNREHHGGTEEDFRNSGSRGTGVNKVTYKTPDYMLCSAQDWHPGQPGYQQHIWQATLGPRAVVFTTHPACASEEGSHRPNFWHGNQTLPRVAQWKDLLVAVYNFAADDWMGFTHAYFPAHAFDKYEIRDGWAFVQSGDGYLALTAARGLDFLQKGDNAFRELRSYGTPNAWVCQMGRAAIDGTFEEFVQKVLALPVKFQGDEVELTSLRGEQVRFGWTGALRINGKVKKLSGFKHYDNPYCTSPLGAKTMDIRYGGEVLRLHFEAPPE